MGRESTGTGVRPDRRLLDATLATPIPWRRWRRRIPEHTGETVGSRRPGGLLYTARDAVRPHRAYRIGLVQSVSGRRSRVRLETSPTDRQPQIAIFIARIKRTDHRP